MNTKKEWEAYLTSFMKAFNAMPELKPILPTLAPLVYQYVITDRPEMNYWQSLDKTHITWGMGEYSGPKAPVMIHKANFETIQKVHAGQADPIAETMAKRYEVGGDMTKLMACVPLLPLYPKAHAKVMKK